MTHISVFSLLVFSPVGFLVSWMTICLILIMKKNDFEIDARYLNVKLGILFILRMQAPVFMYKKQKRCLYECFTPQHI